MSARPLSAHLPSRPAPRARRSGRGFAAPALAASLLLVPALAIFAPAAGAEPDGTQFPAPSGPSQMPFGEQGAENRDGTGAGDQLPNGELPEKAENLGGSVLEEVIDLSTGILKCGLNLVTDSVSCPL